jgi:hypothetical protein
VLRFLVFQQSVEYITLPPSIKRRLFEISALVRSRCKERRDRFVLNAKNEVNVLVRKRLGSSGIKEDDEEEDDDDDPLGRERSDSDDSDPLGSI